MRYAALWLTLAALGTLAVPACRDAFGLEDVFGIWNTESIGGYPLPGIVVYLEQSHETHYVRWVFYEGERCTVTQQVGTFTETYDDCTYTVDVNRGTIAIVFIDRPWHGAIDGRRMTLTDPNDVVWKLNAQ